MMMSVISGHVTVQLIPSQLAYIRKVNAYILNNKRHICDFCN